MITKDQVLKVQKEWGDGVVKIGELKNLRSDCESYTNDFLDRLYSFETESVYLSKGMVYCRRREGSRNRS